MLSMKQSDGHRIIRCGQVTEPTRGAVAVYGTPRTTACGTARLARRLVGTAPRRSS